MNVSSITSRISPLVTTPAYTNEGNPYNKFNGGLKAGSIGVPAAVLTYAAVSGNLKGFSKAPGAAKAMFAFGVLLWAGIGAGLGAIVDAVVNKVKRGKANDAAFANAAEQKQNQEAAIVDEEQAYHKRETELNEVFSSAELDENGVVTNAEKRSDVIAELNK